MGMETKPSVLKLYESFSRLPLGKAMFSRALCVKAPYFTSIRPLVADLRPGYSEIHMHKRRRVLNHIGTVHAIAMCNMAELAAGTMTDVTVPTTHRWIPKGMNVEYLKKATTDLKATAAPQGMPDFSVPTEFPVKVEITDRNQEVVFRAVITMWVT